MRVIQPFTFAKGVFLLSSNAYRNISNLCHFAPVNAGRSLGSSGCFRCSSERRSNGKGFAERIAGGRESTRRLVNRFSWRAEK